MSRDTTTMKNEEFKTRAIRGESATLNIKDVLNGSDWWKALVEANLLPKCDNVRRVVITIDYDTVDIAAHHTPIPAHEPKLAALEKIAEQVD